MNLSLKVLSYENFSFSHERPIDYPYPRLPGGEVLFAQAPFGTICIQEFSTPHCVLRYGVIQPKETITIEIANFVSGVHCFVLQRGTISFQFPGPLSLKLRQGQHAILQADQLQFTMQLEAGKQYIGFEIFFPFAAAATLLEEHPLFLQRLQPDGLRLPDFWLRSPVPTPPSIGQLITALLFFNDADSERGYYYGEEAKEIFSLLLEQPDEMQVPVLTAEQVEKVQLVQSRILEDLGEKETTRQFSKLVGWSESILKRNFKIYTGQAIHQFRKAKRLEFALTLLHEGKLVKEVADQLGLSPGWLIKLYKAKYGTTPATMRKK